MPQTGERVDPFRSFNFLIEIQGIAQGSFTECTGLGSTTESIEHRQGGEGNVRKLPGRTTFSDVTLKWGSTASTELYDWRQRIVDGNVDRQNVSVVVYDMDRSTEVARWNITGAWPSKWELSGLNAKGNEILIETLVLSHEGVVRV
ncbi:phage tail protein [Actinoplanes sp. NPDC051861]|uniref:phage tail protein n=1 Tax=Actinoplanes sp. NPDC051861 TaxID=3155170 RepID=UPI003428CEBD